ncbi:MAG: hypothetical protein J0L74_06540, partial [Burkholderiales bacterium]|nr:hypothetical protein [Burkholderiales bacterium]
MTEFVWRAAAADGQLIEGRSDAPAVDVVPSLEGTAYTLPLQEKDTLPAFLQRVSLNVRLFVGKMWAADSL